MEIQLINGELMAELHRKAAESERLRQNFDLRTTPEDGSQRMLNVLEVGTKVPIHRHSIEVHELSTIFEAKDGKYVK